MMHEFAEFWRDRFPSIPPISSVVRDNNLDRWMRRHALPRSKRYADTPEELAEILRRANTIGDELFGDNPDCWMAHVSYYCDRGGALEPQLQSLGLDLAYNDIDPSKDLDVSKVAIYAARVRWVAGAFDDALRRVANEEIYSLIWVSVATGTVFAPYDGGFDIIFPTREVAVRCGDLWPEWRSVYPGEW